MARHSAGPEIERLIMLLARLPGLGPRSARKAALALLKRRADLLEPLASAMSEAAANIIACPNCGSADTERVSEFGSTACKAQYRCTQCREPFEYFKCI